MNLALVLLCAAPHVVVVQRSTLGVQAATVNAVLAEVKARVEATQLEVSAAPACARGVDCLDASAAVAGVDAAVAVSLAAGPRGLSVDLEAKTHAGETVGTWTGALPVGTTKLPRDADIFFSALQRALAAPKPTSAPEPLVTKGTKPEVEATAAEPLRPAKPLLISGAAAGAVSLGLSIAALVLKGPLDAQLSMMPVVTGLTRAQANQQVSTVNGLFSASLGLGLAAAGLLVAGLIALLLD